MRKQETKSYEGLLKELVKFSLQKRKKIEGDMVVNLRYLKCPRVEKGLYRSTGTRINELKPLVGSRF